MTDDGTTVSSPSLGRLAALLRWQTERPWLLLAIALLTAAGAAFLASKLSLKTSFGELLPENKESVIVADEVAKRLPAVSTLAVVVEGSDNDGIKRFIDDLAPEIEKIGQPLVFVVDRGVQDSRAFFEEHKFLYADLELVEEVHDEILDRYDYEVQKRAGFLLDEDPEDAPPPLTEESIRKRLEERTKESGVAEKAAAMFPDGYYMNLEQHHAALLVRTPIGAGDVEKTEALTQAIQQAIDGLGPLDRYDPELRVGFSGNLISSAETRKEIEGDLAHVGIWGVCLILGVVFLYYLRVRTVVAMTLTVGIGAIWTFGCAYFLVGHLNQSSGFLFAIVVGNGINFGIIYMARYLEARRTRAVPESLAIAHRETWLSTLTAAGAATCAYGSLAVTDFRGFKHFGLIGGSGMLLCWVATYLFLPAILVLTEKLSPIQQPSGFVAKVRGVYGKPFAFVASRFPRAVTIGGLLITIVSGYFAYGYVANDPLEYNMRNIANDDIEGEPSEARRLGSIADQVVGRQGQDGLAIAVDRLDQVKPLKEALEARKEAAPEDAKPFESVVTIYSLLPTQQEEKLELVREARETLENAHAKGFMSDEDWKKVDDLLPADKLHTIGIDDLPEQVARSFTEADGTRGRLVYIVPKIGRSVWDAHYLITWADSFRETPLPDGSVVKGSGHSVIFADVIQAIVEDAPKAIIVSLITTLFVVLLAFRGRSHGIAVIVSVLIGLVWTLAILALWHSGTDDGTRPFTLEPMKLNFLNFVALPITIGVGADYAVNVMQRYRHADGEVRRVVVETGGAVVLCSLTTMLGYTALTLSINRAVQSFGIAAAAGEVCCVLTGVLVLPAALLWLRERGGKAASGDAVPASSPEP